MASLIVELQAKLNVAFENLAVLRRQAAHIEALIVAQQRDLERLATELAKLAGEERPT